MSRRCHALHLLDQPISPINRAPTMTLVQDLVAGHAVRSNDRFGDTKLVDPALDRLERLPHRLLAYASKDDVASLSTCLSTSREDETNQRCLGRDAQALWRSEDDRTEAGTTKCEE